MTAALALAALVVLRPPTVTSAEQESPPPIPTHAPVLMVGHPDVGGGDLGSHRSVFALGRIGKQGPLKLGERIEVRAVEESVLERLTENGREILRRSTVITRPDSDQVLSRATIDMDPETLLPLRARSEQGGTESTVEYDWDAYVVRRTAGSGDGMEPVETPLDIAMFEVGAHDVWMGALPLRQGFVARLPVIFAATGTKYWAVPRVVGSEPIDLGDGKPRPAWVVELDWWGMGAANNASNYSPGGGVNGTGGTGGKYWVLKKAVPGKPRVVRVRTEIDVENDSVSQIQEGA